MDPRRLCTAWTFENAHDWLRYPEAAALSGRVSLRTVRRRIDLGFAVASKPSGGAVLISRDSERDPDPRRFSETAD